MVGVLWWRKNGRDQRYAGLAPGHHAAGRSDRATIVPNDPDLPIPVAFSPPRIPVAEAGLLIDGQVDTRETAATIIDLAVRGALTVQSSGDDDFRVTLVDPERAAAPHEMVLLTSLFDGEPPGAIEDLSDAGQPARRAHEAMQASVRNQVDRPRLVPQGAVGHGDRQLRLRRHRAGRLRARSRSAPGCCWMLVPLLPIIITVAVIRAKLRRGQRTAEGRAVCDQVEGFKTYLATAEADQLRFEEGEDIFSKYLPWAIAFELADRWAKICADLVAMGRLPDATPVLVRRQLPHGRLQHRLPHQQPGHRGHPGRRRRAAAAPASAAAARSAAAASPAAVAAAAAAAAGESRQRPRTCARPDGRVPTWLADVDQVDHEDQRLARPDHAAGAAVAVRQVRRDDQLAAAADLHPGDALVPARR